MSCPVRWLAHPAGRPEAPWWPGGPPHQHPLHEALSTTYFHPHMVWRLRGATGFPHTRTHCASPTHVPMCVRTTYSPHHRSHLPTRETHVVARGSPTSARTTPLVFIHTAWSPPNLHPLHIALTCINTWSPRGLNDELQPARSQVAIEKQQ